MNVETIETFQGFLDRAARAGQPSTPADDDCADLLKVWDMGRDCDRYNRSNFAVVKRMLESAGVTVEIVRYSHWVCGWIDHLLCEDTNESRELILKIRECHEDYPILDDDHHSQLEYDEIIEFWETCTVEDRAEYLREANINPYWAKDDTLPDDPDGRLWDSLLECA